MSAAADVRTAGPALTFGRGAPRADGAGPITRAGIRYAWRELAERAGAGEGGDVSVRVVYGRPEDLPAAEPTIVVTPCDGDAFRTALAAPAGSLRWLPVEDVLPRDSGLGIRGRIPALFWGGGGGIDPAHERFLERRGDVVVFHCDLFAATLFMLSRWEETVVPVRDRHDRFPARASFAFRQGFLDRPVVDQYALVLRAWIRALRPAWTPREARFTVRPTHDIDRVRRFRPWWKAGRTVAGDVLRRRDPARAAAAAVAAVREVLAPGRAAYVRTIRTLAAWTRESGLERAAFYFMAAGPDAPGDPHPPDYEIGARVVRRCIRELRDQGHEVGFHPGYTTPTDAERWLGEKRRFDAVAGPGAYGGRQHYLRFRVPHTWRIWERAGMAYDSSAGYADREGFRCGTCRPFRPFDIERDRELNLLERPLIVMDATLRGYRGLGPVEAVELVLDLAERCREVEGTFTLLWHNTALTDDWADWGEGYRRILAALGAASGG